MSLAVSSQSRAQLLARTDGTEVTPGAVVPDCRKAPGECSLLVAVLALPCATSAIVQLLLRLLSLPHMDGRHWYFSMTRRSSGVAQGMRSNGDDCDVDSVLEELDPEDDRRGSVESSRWSSFAAAVVSSSCSSSSLSETSSPAARRLTLSCQRWSAAARAAVRAASASNLAAVSCSARRCASAAAWASFPSSLGSVVSSSADPVPAEAADAVGVGGTVRAPGVRVGLSVAASDEPAEKRAAS
eukprot:g42917.t1